MKAFYSLSRFSLLLLLVVSSTTIELYAQNGVGINTVTPQAALDVVSTTTGILIPRMTSAQRTAISSPPTGSLVYQNNGTTGFYYYDGSAWRPLLSNSVGSAGGWALTGNAGTTAGTNFIGTTDAVDFVVGTNNSEKMRVTSGGNVGIGTTSIASKFVVSGGDIQVESGQGRFKGWYNAGSGLGIEVGVSSGDGYMLTYNRSTSAYSNTNIASNSALLTVNTNGNITMMGSNVGVGTTSPGVKFDVNGDIRTNSNLYVSGLRFTSNGDYYLRNFSGNNSAGGFELMRNDGNRWGYFYGDGSGIGILHGAGGWSILSGGSVNAANTYTAFYTSSAERVRIDASGNVGIGTTGPSARLHVTGGGAILGTNGTSSNTRTFTILSDGQSQLNFGSYPGAWTSALQIQSNDNARYVWLSPLDNASGGNARLLAYNSGLDFYVGANAQAVTITSAGNVGIGTASPSFKLHVPSGYIGTDYINTSDNSVGSGVTGVMVKAGDNYLRTGTAASVLSFLGVTAPTGDNLGNHTATTTLNMNGNNITNAGDILSNQNYGLGLVGVYASTRYQNVFAMGSAYRLAADGTSPGNLYGLAWTHSNVGGQSISNLGHQLLIMSNGDTRSAIGDGIWTKYQTTSPIYYDQNNTGYYVDPDGTTNIYAASAYTRGGAFNLSYNTFNRRDYTGDVNYWTGTNGWSNSHTWATAWKLGAGGVDLWGTGMDHPQGGGYIHAQGIVSGLHYNGGTDAYGWMMVGAHNATDNRYWLRGKWASTTSAWTEMITTNNLSGNAILNQFGGAQSANHWISGSSRAADVYASSWLRNDNVNTGLYNQATGLHWYSESNSYWSSTSTGAGGILLRDGHAGTIKGYLYQDDAGSFGLLSPAGSWRLRVDNSNTEAYGGFYAGTSYQSYIYDRDNTGYYLDPNGSSYTNYFGRNYGWNWVEYDWNDGNYYTDLNGSSRFNYLGRNYGWNWTEYDWNDAAYYTDLNSGSRFNYLGRNYGWNWTEYDWNDAQYYMDLNNVSIVNDMRARIFYDYDNTGYYLDPAGTTNINYITNRTKASFGHNGLYNTPRWAYTGDTRYWTGSMGWGTTDLNTIFSNWGGGNFDTWSSPANGPGGSSHYVGMQAMHFNHGDGTNAYGFQLVCAGEADNRFFLRSGWPSPRSWVEILHTGNLGGNAILNQWGGNQSANFHISGTGRAGSDFRAPIFYDENNTGYYLDPNNGSQMSAVYANNWFRAQGTCGLYWQDYGGGWYMQDGTWIRGYNDRSLWMGNGLIGGQAGLTVGYGGAGSPGGGGIIAGNLGVGTASPATRLHVFTQADNNVALFQGTEPYITINAVGATNTAGINLAPSSGYDGWINNNSGGDIRFLSNFSERARLTSGGNLGLGTSSPTAKLDVQGNISAGYSLSFMFNANATFPISTGSQWCLTDGTIQMPYYGIAAARWCGAAKLFVSGQSGINFFTNTGGGGGAGNVVDQSRMSINYLGDVGIGTNLLDAAERLEVWGNIRATGAIYSVSDARYKKDIKPLENSLSKILKLQGVSYNWKTDNEYKDLGFDDRLQIGVIAQEVEKIYPELVKTNSNGYKSVDYIKLTPILVEGMKEQQQLIETQNSKIQTLEEKFKAMEQENKLLNAKMNIIENLLNKK